MTARVSSARHPQMIVAFVRRHAQLLSWIAFSTAYLFALIVAFI